MTFVDRVSAYPGRYIMTTEDGSATHVVLERDDEPIVVGTPLNAETFNGIFAGLYPAQESTTYPGCFYREVDGEIEWLNPPMVVDMQYRTVERYKGLPVYVKLVKFVQNTNVLTPIVPKNYKIISVSAVARSVEDVIAFDGTHSGAETTRTLSDLLIIKDDAANQRILLPAYGVEREVEITAKFVKE